MINLKPLCERLICRRIPAETIRASGIILPGAEKEKTGMAVVLAAGPGDPNEFGVVQPMDVKAGDTILFGQYSGQELRHEGEDYLVIRERDVMAVVEAAND